MLQLILPTLFFLRTRPVVIVEASLDHPEAINRTNFDCTENGMSSVCMDLTLCFSYKGKEVPGYIGKLPHRVNV